MSESTTEHEKMMDMRKQLDWELSLDSSELVSHGWYHGALERAQAEALLPHDGSFLVRDSSTQPGHYVLSCRQGAHHLHFVINRVVIQPDTVYEHFQYQFESEAYDTVPDLVTSYVGSGKPISVASGVRIQTPSNRNVPLLCRPSTLGRGASAKTFSLNAPWKSSIYCASGHNSSDSLSSCKISPSCNSTGSLRKASSLCCPNKATCNMACPCRAPLDNHKANHTATDNFSISNNRKIAYSSSESAQINQSAIKSISFNEHNAFLSTYNTFASESADASFSYKKQRSLSLSPGEILQMSYQKSSSADGIIHDAKKPDGKDEGKPDAWENGSQGSPPAKPVWTQPPVYQASGSDSGNGSGDSAQSSAPGDTPKSGDAPRANPTKRRPDIAYAEEMLANAQALEFNQTTILETETYRTGLFSSFENKPLESDTLETIKMMLRTSEPKVLATHLTRVDFKYVMSPKATEQSPLDKVTGLELCLLPHGDQMRTDIIERAECMKFLIIVTILTCQSDVERARVLNDWIQLAIETKMALGNLFGFSIIMLGLCTKQIECIGGMWDILRQKHTYSAFTFETKLRPCYKNMNDCVDSSPPNTTLPHLIPVINILYMPETEKRWEDFGVHTSDFGMSAVAAHLEAARKYPEQVPLYERNARAALTAISTPIDDDLLDLFRTEFHIKFLWGARGAFSAACDRHSKLSDVLNTMADRYLTPVAAK